MTLKLYFCCSLRIQRDCLGIKARSTAVSQPSTPVLRALPFDSWCLLLHLLLVRVPPWASEARHQTSDSGVAFWGREFGVLASGICCQRVEIRFSGSWERGVFNSWSVFGAGKGALTLCFEDSYIEIYTLRTKEIYGVCYVWNSVDRVSRNQPRRTTA